MKQINFNSVLIMVVGGLITAGISKIDKTNTLIIKTASHVDDLTAEVTTLRDHMDRQDVRISKVETDVEILKSLKRN